MIREYFAGAEWHETMPGIDSCVLDKIKSSVQYPVSLPLIMSPNKAEIIFCISGKMTLRSCTDQVKHMGSRSVMLFSDCNHLKSVEINEPFEGICLSIDKETAKSNLSQLCRIYGDIPITPNVIEDILEKRGGVSFIPPQSWSQSAFQSMMRLSPNSRPQYCIMKCFELIYLIYMGHAEADEQPKVWESDHMMHMAKAMQRFIMEHLGEKLTIDDISRHFHLSATACKTCFRTCCEQPIHQWISNKRMERAAELLESSNMSVIAVAQTVGYSGCSQFNYVFKKKFGKTPREYRNSVRYR